MPFPLIEDKEPQDYWMRQGRFEQQQAWTEGVAATAEQALDNTGMGAIGDMYVQESLNRIEGQKTLSVEELNDKYDGTGIMWTSPHKEAVADYIAREHARKGDLQRRIEMSSGGVGSSVANFATQMFVQGPEMMLGGYGVAGMMKAGGFLQGASFAARAGMSFAENTVGTVPIELAVMARDRQMEMDISLTGSLVNILAGGVLGVGIEGLRSGVPLALKNKRVQNVTKRIKDRITPIERAQISEVAASHIAENRMPMVSPILELMRDRVEGRGPRPTTDFSGRSKNNFVNYGAEEKIQGKFYSGTDGRVEELGMTAPVDDGFGPGLRGTSDIFVENSRAAQAQGLVHQFDLNARLAPIDELISAESAKGVAKLLREIDPDGALGLGKLAEAVEAGDVSLREVYDNLDVTGKEVLNNELMKQGYQGLHGVEGDAGNERNFVHVFPEHAPAVVTPGAALEHDPRFVKEPSPEEWNDFLQKYHAPENKLFHNPELQEHTDAQVKKAQEVDMDEPEVMAEAMQDTTKLAKQMEAEGVATPELQALIKEFDEATTTPKGEKPDYADGGPTEKPSVLAEQRALLDDRNYLYSVIDGSIGDTRNQALDRLTLTEGRMRELGMDPANLVVEVSDHSATLMDAEMAAPPSPDNPWSGEKFNLDANKPLGMNESRLYQGTEFRREGPGAGRTHGRRVAEPFIIKREGDRYISARDKNGRRIMYIDASRGRNGVLHSSFVSGAYGWEGSGVGGAMYRELSAIAGGEGKLRPDRNFTTSEAAWKSHKLNNPEGLIAHVREEAKSFFDAHKPGERWDWAKQQGPSFQEGGTYAHVSKDINEAIASLRAGTQWTPPIGQYAEAPGMRLAPVVEGMPPVPEVAPTFAERVKEAEKIMKSLYTCIGSNP